MADFLLEIGTEEIPARFIEAEKEGILKLLTEGFNATRLEFGKIDVYGTPRRLAVFVENVSEVQKEVKTVKFGPPVNRAYDTTGNPTKAAIGFAKSQGVEIEDLKGLLKIALNL